MERLTERNSMGVAVYKIPYACGNCNEELYRLPDYGNGSPTDKLAEYEYAEEQGLLLKLPCKVGDKVYELIPRVRGANNFRENEVVAIKVYCDSVYLSLKNGFPKDIKQIGKILFLTKEEAEQSLKRMEGE